MNHKIFVFVTFFVLTFVTSLLGSLSAQLLIIDKTDGCNNYGGHGQQGPVTTQLTQWASNYSWTTTVISDNDDYSFLNPDDYCIVALSYVSGDGVVSTLGESNFFQNFNGTVISVHSGADAERHPNITNCNSGNADVFFANSVIGASLRNGGCNQKHECKGDSEVIYKDPASLNHPLCVGLPNSQTLNDIELYFVGPTISGTHWNPGNLVVWRAQEDGPGSEDIPVMWVTPQGHITLTLGHHSNILDPSEISFILMKRMWDVAVQTSCLNPFPVELAYFDSDVKKGVVQLNWETLSESQNKGFRVMSRVQGTAWRQLDYVDGNGDMPAQYSTLLYNLPEGPNYFTLIQEDYDGKMTVHPSIEGEVRYPFSVYHPVNFPDYVYLTGAEGYISITDAVGRIVYEGSSKDSRVTLNVAQWPAGLYTVRVQKGAVNLFRKFSKDN